jgi:3',5'-cyclic AMP phosphodiesterase CpdA
MLIAQITDIHIGFDPDAKPEELNRIRFRAVLDRLIKAPNAPDLLVLSGDLTDRGDAESFTKTAAMLSKRGFDLLPMVGNHDTRKELLRAFPDCPIAPADKDGFVHYVVEREGLRIICLDTLEEGRHGGAFCDKRRDWLRSQLEQSDLPCVLFMHHPPIISGIDWMDPAPGEPWMTNIADAIAGHERKIQAIHCGHLHRPISTQFCGVPLSVTPSVAPLVSLDLRAISPDTADARGLITTENPTYALHHWDGEHLVSHYEEVSDWEYLAYYGPHLQPMIREMFAERE